VRGPRVALVAPFGLRPKGTTIGRVLPIGRVLAKRGATVRLLIPPWDDRARSGDRWYQDGVQIVHTRAAGSPLEMALILSDLGREIREFRPTVVHAFKPIGYSGAVAWWLATVDRRGGSPRIVVDADDLEGPAGWAGRRGTGLGGRIRGVQETLTLRVAPHVTVASHWLADHATRLGHKPGEVLYLPNGQDEQPLEAVDEEPGTGTSADGLTLLWYTRFTETTAARIVRLLAPLLAEVGGLRLAVIGEEIAEGARASIGAAFTAAGMAYQVDWLGYEPRGVERYLAKRRGRVVAVYPMDDDLANRARCPSKVPQLMALGVPIVAEAVGEIPYYLAGFETDCLVAPGDVTRFQDRVRFLAGDAGAREALGGRLRTAAACWHWDQTAGGLLDWYLAN
jgi:glycosyltransferase involved in cell wall biosynthesis